MSHSSRRAPVHMVTQAHRSLSDDIAYRQRRYLLMMGIRAICFVIAVCLYVNHFGWLAAVPALGLAKLHVERKNVGDTLVSADVGFVIYLRGA